MTLAQIADRIAQDEERMRVYDNAPATIWAHEHTVAGQHMAELTRLRVAKANAEYKAEARDDWRGLECSEAMESCDREACRKMLGRAA